MSTEALAPHPILGCAESVAAAVKEVRDLHPVFMSSDQKQAAVIGLDRAIAMLTELKHRVLAAATDEEAQEAGFRDVTGWLAKTTRADRSDARSATKLAEVLDHRWTRVAQGMADGDVTAAQAKAVTDAL